MRHTVRLLKGYRAKNGMNCYECRCGEVIESWYLEDARHKHQLQVKKKKHCKKCNKDKIESEFHKDRTRKSGRVDACKECINKRCRELKQEKKRFFIGSRKRKV